MDLLAPAAVKKLARELGDLQEKPPEGIRVIINEQNLADVQAEIEGPVNTPYEGGVFRMRLVIGQDWPTAPPKGFFTTRIFHPNVSSSGEICVNVLKKDWTADTELRHVLLVVKCLLVEPNPESALNEEAGKLLLENYEEYASHARLMTSIHAQTARRPGPLTQSGGNASTGNAAATAGDGQNKEGGSPAKKAKAETAAAPATKAAAAAKQVKKSLKRL